MRLKKNEKLGEIILITFFSICALAVVGLFGWLLVSLALGGHWGPVIGFFSFLIAAALVSYALWSVSE